MDVNQFVSTCALLPRRRALSLLAVVTTLVFCLPGGALAQAPQPAPEAGIVVTGEGSVNVTPTNAQISIGATVHAKTVTEALDANSRVMTSVIAALKGAGVTASDITTVRFSVQPIYAPAPSSASPDLRAGPKLAGFSVSNEVYVTIRDISKTGALIDRAVTAGANDIGDMSFSVFNASRLLDEAREAAIADARRKAEVYAKASGVRLGAVQWITEDGGSGPPVPMMARAAMAPVPIASGEHALRVRVTVGFAIAR